MDQDVNDALLATSRTFFLPISQLPDGLRQAVAAAYLCMRAIDEIEDHPTLRSSEKARVLRQVSRFFQAQSDVAHFAADELTAILRTPALDLPPVTRRLADWACYVPAPIAPRVWDATAAMADRMAHWSVTHWRVRTEADLDRYTYGVAGAVGLLLCDLWAWHDGQQMDRAAAIAFGRGLQAVNIARNQAEDAARGVSFFPRGWDLARMHAYARQHLQFAAGYARDDAPYAFAALMRVPLGLALATLDALEQGREKLTREEVMMIVAGV
ncbi:MAG TPA: phytoene/squalene synthase family protein [Ktedonobacterales bacterium]